MAKQPAASAPTSDLVVIYGRQGCGKTRNGAALAKYYGKRAFDDLEEINGRPTTTRSSVLYFTNAPHAGAIAFADAMRAAGLKG